jgi:hypothetical protein
MAKPSVGKLCGDNAVSCGAYRTGLQPSRAVDGKSISDGAGYCAVAPRRCRGDVLSPTLGRRRFAGRERGHLLFKSIGLLVEADVD